jgi:hypothetical protein
LNLPKTSEDIERPVQLGIVRRHLAAVHKISMQIWEIDRPIGKKELQFERKYYLVFEGFLENSKAFGVNWLRPY